MQRNMNYPQQQNIKRPRKKTFIEKFFNIIGVGIAGISDENINNPDRYIDCANNSNLIEPNTIENGNDEGETSVKEINNNTSSSFSGQVGLVYTKKVHSMDDGYNAGLDKDVNLDTNIHFGLFGGREFFKTNTAPALRGKLSASQRLSFKNPVTGEEDASYQQEAGVQGIGGVVVKPFFRFGAYSRDQYFETKICGPIVSTSQAPESKCEGFNMKWKLNLTDSWMVKGNIKNTIDNLKDHAMCAYARLGKKRSKKACSYTNYFELLLGKKYKLGIFSNPIEIFTGITGNTYSKVVFNPNEWYSINHEKGSVGLKLEASTRCDTDGLLPALDNILFSLSCHESDVRKIRKFGKNKSVTIAARGNFKQGSFLEGIAPRLACTLCVLIFLELVVSLVIVPMWDLVFLQTK